MFSFLLILVVLFEMRSNAHSDMDSPIYFPGSSGPTVENHTDLGIPSQQVITMNGHNIYHAAQQIFYVYGPQQLKRQNEAEIPSKTHRSDYMVTPGIGIHKLHESKLSWNRARRACIAEGGHLAVINSKAEENVFIGLLREHNMESAWLGVHDLYEEGDWVTVLDQPLELSGYVKWSSKYGNQPDNYNGRQNCARLLSDGGMDDLECSSAHHFICEVSQLPLGV